MTDADVVYWDRCTVADEDMGSLCRGVQVGGFARCLAHLNIEERAGFLAAVAPGARVDLRGTRLDSQVVTELIKVLAALNSTDLFVRLNEADFTDATFADPVDFTGVTFNGPVDFTGVTFNGPANFTGVTFAKRADFTDATFAEGADFTDATFVESATFDGATFTEYADFDHVTFTELADFDGATFTEYTDFDHVTFTDKAYFNSTTFADHADFAAATFAQGAYFTAAYFTRAANFADATFTKPAYLNHVTFAEDGYFTAATFAEGAYFADVTFTMGAYFNMVTFTEDARFTGATFAESANFAGTTFTLCTRLGPLVADHVILDSAQFGVAVVIETETRAMSCRRARFAAGAELRVRYGRVDLAEAYFGAASSLASATEFRLGRAGSEGKKVHATDGEAKRWRAENNLLDHRAMLTSLRGTDVSELALTDVDLRCCRFAGAHHLDKLRIEGDSPFLTSRRTWGRSTRRVLYEEYRWRTEHDWRGWAQLTPPELSEDRVEQVEPDRLAALYRSLRKALEDGKNEPGAGDFYYGEQEARRHASSSSPVEKAILRVYWLISGYGQRASRALVAFLGLVAVTTVLLITCGLPTSGPASQISTVTRTTPAGAQQAITVAEDVPPQLPPANVRWTWIRTETSIRIALGAVVFRDAGQKLTTTGVWTVMVARFTGPILLALAALAVRARVKR